MNVNRIRIADAGKHTGEPVEIAGWLYNLRKSGKIVFPLVRDGSGIMQCVAVKAALPEETFRGAERTSPRNRPSSSAARSAQITARRAGSKWMSRAPRLCSASRVGALSDHAKDHGIDFLMDHRHLWLRSRRQHAILRVRQRSSRRIRDYFDSHGFTLVDTPIFTPAACEGTTTLFAVDYFEDEKAYLTQSGQLYNEATAMAFGKVYCFGPTFRAEKSKTRRHLTEFWMVEPEMAYADSRRRQTSG